MNNHELGPETTSELLQELQKNLDEAGLQEAVERLVSSLETLQSEASSRVNKLQTAANESHERLTNEMQELLDELRDRYGFTATQVLGGAH